MSTQVIVRTTLQYNASPIEGLRLSKINENPIGYQNLEVVKKISKKKFPVCLASSKASNQNYVMKVFPDDDQESTKYYENESRFASLDHPNVINIVNYDKERTLFQRGIFMRVTYVLSEYAPHGDFFDFIIKYKSEVDDKLVRTYFKQLIEGLEYLHSLGIAHLDLKPENLLIGSDFNLKIADFDLSHIIGDKKILSRGTRNYRAPELYNSSSSGIDLENTFAADIYSAGLILFILKSRGVFPQIENHELEGVNLTKLMHKNHRKFWSTHRKLRGKDKSFFESSFKELFHKMVKADPKKRISIKKIKQSKWYSGPVYTPEELSLKMKAIFNC